jgi:hypothetical protein
MIKDYKISREKEIMVHTLIRQAARWSTAAKQDTIPMVAVLHANYGVGYLLALKDIFSQNDIEKYGKIDLMKFEREILLVQDAATKKASDVCEQFGPPSTYLTGLSGEKN